MKNNILEEKIYLLLIKSLINGNAKYSQEITKVAIDLKLNPNKIIRKGIIPSFKLLKDKSITKTLITTRAVLFSLATLFNNIQKIHNYSGNIIIASIREDLHSVSNKIIDYLLSSLGFNIYNLGVDIHHKHLLNFTNKYHPLLIILSNQLSKEKSIKILKNTISYIKNNAECKPLILVGGESLNKKIALHVNADYYFKNIFQAVNYIKKLSIVNKNY